MKNYLYFFDSIICLTFCEFVWSVFGGLLGIFQIFIGAVGIHNTLVYHWNPYVTIPIGIISIVVGILGLGIHTKRLCLSRNPSYAALSPMKEMKELLIQIWTGFLMASLFVVAALAIVVTWVFVMLYYLFQWMVTEDGYSHNKSQPLDPKLEEQFDSAFSNKPFPKPYSPTENPLYIPKPEYPPTHEELEQLKAKLPPFDREKVFKMVDESSARMSKMTQKERHNLRGEKGRFIKKK